MLFYCLNNAYRFKHGNLLLLGWWKYFDQYILQSAGTASSCLKRRQKMLSSLAGKIYYVIKNILKKDTTFGIVIFYIFVSRSGRRILVAQERMASLGYTSLRLYRSAYIFGFWFLSCKIKSHKRHHYQFSSGAASTTGRQMKAHYYNGQGRQNGCR